MLEVTFQIIAAIFSFTGAGGDTWVCFDETDEWNCSQISQGFEAEGREVVYVGQEDGIQAALDTAKPVGSLSAEAAPRETAAKPAHVPAAVAPVQAAPVPEDRIEEDEPGFDCETMGNKVCGPVTGGPYPGPDPEEPVTGGPYPGPSVPLYHGTTGLVEGCMIDYLGTVTCDDGTTYEADPERYDYSVEQGL